MALSARMRPATLGPLEKVARLHWPLVTLLLMIGGAGYLLLYSAGGGSHEPWAWRHGVRLAAGLGVMLAFGMIDPRHWFRVAYPFYAVVLVMLIGVELIGVFGKGAQRWLDLGVIQLQPSELMKIALVLALARYFHSAWLEEIRRPLYLLPPVLMIAAPVVLVLLQPDLGTALMLAAVGGAFLFLAGVRLWKFAVVIGAVAAAAPVLWSRMHDYQRQRVFTFLNPESDPLGSGYHIIQSKIALGSGGFWGKGFLKGSQAQLSFLPEKHTDFAFTMLGEETGFAGAVLVLGLYFAVILCGLYVALRASSQFGRLLAMGITVNFSLYVIINIAMVSGLIPVVGVPLPLISYGGTAMLTVLAGFGLVLSVEAHRELALPRFLGER
ncbi:MAG: rod shape-determining protein RodA [Geminicoccaceae bacterium]